MTVTADDVDATISHVVAVLSPAVDADRSARRAPWSGAAGTPPSTSATV
ncbi:hypothetical protein ACFQX6_63990 [Streptosporangium lutulentum]